VAVDGFSTPQLEYNMGSRGVIYSWNLSCIVLLLILQVKNIGGGLTIRSSRLAREIYPEIEPDSDRNQAPVCIVGDVVYAVDELVPAEQPCLKCKCQPPGVHCETIKCAKKSRCKAIHRPNKCCPDYQCECQHEGRIYANGEKLPASPGGECKVCYCRGGELQCAEVSCYIRTDCEPKTVPGQCCPKYDHCPPKEPFSGRPVATTDKSLTNSSTEILELWPLNTLVPKSSEEVTNATQSYNFEDAKNIPIKPKTSTTDLTDDSFKEKITIQEIVPEIKEIPATDSSKLNESQIGDNKDLLDSDINDLIVTDSEPDSSEISEVFQQPPPVLRIGDKLLFLKQGELVPEKDVSTPTSVITIIGAEGLQRGFEDSAEFHEVTNHSETLLNNSNDLELKGAESTHILSLVKHKARPATTTTIPDTSTLLTTTQSAELTTFEENEENSTSSFNFTVETTTILVPEPPTLETSTSMEWTDDDNGTTVVGDNSTRGEITELPYLAEMQKNETSEQFVTPGASEESSTEDTLGEVRKESSTEETSGEVRKESSTEETLDEVRIESDGSESTTTETNVDKEVTTNTFVEEIVTPLSNVEHSKESLEETTEESGENTTPKGHVSAMSIENASVESSEGAESVDMVQEVAPNTQIDVMHDLETRSEENKTDAASKDVELIDVHDGKLLQSNETELPPRSIDKRESSSLDENDEVFRQLEFELNASNTERTQTMEEEKKESDTIFQELGEEIETPKTAKGAENAETLQRVTDAIAKLTFREKKNSLDGPSILGLLSNFFGSQQRHNGKK
jgi:hypothetical protein